MFLHTQKCLLFGGYYLKKIVENFDVYKIMLNFAAVIHYNYVEIWKKSY
jgi:hypothetical protein